MTTDTPCRVLLVDDDPAVLRDYGSALRRLGEVVEASDGAEALAHLAGQPFDAIVTDIAMPRLSGIEFLELVRRHDLDVPVILITGNPDLSSAMKAVEYGALQYLPKPVSLETLWSAVRRASSIRQLARLRREALSLEGSTGKSLGDRAALDARFQRALDMLCVTYQPVVSWSHKRLIGFDAVAGSDEPALSNPSDLLDAAERLGRIPELGRIVRGRVEAAAHETRHGLFFVGLHHAELNDFSIYSEDAPLTAIAGRVVFDFTERLSFDSVKEAGARLTRLREMGFRIALDDFGAGYAGLSSFGLLEPDYVKLDRSLIHGIDESTRRQSIVRAMLRLCQGELGMLVVCKGVETSGERDALVYLGADLFQGALFGAPEGTPREAQWKS